MLGHRIIITEQRIKKEVAFHINRLKVIDKLKLALSELDNDYEKVPDMDFEKLLQLILNIGKEELNLEEEEILRELFA